MFASDLALRPNGNSGPPPVSLAMLEDYLQAHGREWERFAWLKSRVVAPMASVKNGRALRWRSLVTAFVYRRYLDYGVFEGLRSSTPRCATRRSAAPPAGRSAPTTSCSPRGGIRGIEFIVQLLLVVRGGQFPEIRTRSTLKALDKLAAGGLMKRASAERLAAAYTLLRRVEHRIYQYLDDQQTHVLPEHDGDLAWIAATLGAEASGRCALLDRLAEAREFVAGEFDLLLRDGRRQRGQRLQVVRPGADAGRCRDASSPSSARTGGARPVAVLTSRRSGSSRTRARSASPAWSAAPRRPSPTSVARCQAAILFLDWLEPLLRRESYLALLAERPEVQNRLLRLLGLPAGRCAT